RASFTACSPKSCPASPSSRSAGPRRASVLLTAPSRWPARPPSTAPAARSHSPRSRHDRGRLADHPEEPMLKMNYWTDKWDLHVNVCPCDVHFNDWVEAKGLAGKTIYHFGTGTHHVVGLRQAELGNSVFAITASKEEYETYVALVTENARVAKAYLAYFGDIYLTNARLLPDLAV